jgi:dTDP-4-amino-4,6-dideoxygalactose transaminase
MKDMPTKGAGFPLRPLAICGAGPCFTSPKYVGTPTIPDREMLHSRLDQMLDAKRLTNDGPFVQEFEERLSRMNDGVEVVAVCNATVGMQLLLKAMNLNGEVILPSFTFIATAHACAWEGLEPVFVDIDGQTHTIDPARVAEAVTERTAAIIGVHLWGRMCQVRELEAIAANRRLPLIFDAAHALECTYAGRPMGVLGTASVVSFHATKFIQSLEGGAILTPDRKLAARLRLMRNFGFQGYDNVVALGTNAKLDEFSAAMGLGSLEGLDALIQKNRSNRVAYRHALAGLPGLSLFEFDEGERNNFQYLIVEVTEDACPFTRDEVVTILHAENVIARRYFHPGCHRSAPYRDLRNERSWKLPITERICDTLIALPTGAGVTPDDIEAIGEILRESFSRRDEVTQYLRPETARKKAA